jgi:small subunit ribosomal protein S9
VAESTIETPTDDVEADAPSSYTSESAPVVTERKSASGPGEGIVPGTGRYQINGRELAAYFPNKVHQQIVNEPFKVLELDGAFDVLARVHGGGPSGQAGAMRLGIARALNVVDADANRSTLKKAGFLTRDARAVERKKAGLKKARKAPQYSKR